MLVSMAQSINRTHPVQVTLTLTTTQAKTLRAKAKREGISVREFLRQIIDDHGRQQRIRMRFTPDLVALLGQIAQATGDSTEALVAQYAMAGAVHHATRLGLIPYPATDTDAPAACARCQQAFDPIDTRFNGHARHNDTPWCRRCVDECHGSTDAGHICAVCR